MIKIGYCEIPGLSAGERTFGASRVGTVLARAVRLAHSLVFSVLYKVFTAWADLLPSFSGSAEGHERGDAPANCLHAFVVRHENYAPLLARRAAAREERRRDPVTFDCRGRYGAVVRGEQDGDYRLAFRTPGEEPFMLRLSAAELSAICRAAQSLMGG